MRGEPQTGLPQPVILEEPLTLFPCVKSGSIVVPQTCCKDEAHTVPESTFLLSLPDPQMALPKPEALRQIPCGTTRSSESTVTGCVPWRWKL